MYPGLVLAMAVLLRLLMLLPTLAAAGLAMAVGVCMGAVCLLALRGQVQLSRATPKDAYLIANFARADEAPPGQGSAFLRGLTGEADSSSRLLALRTCHPSLVRYYETHGFGVAESARMPWRQTSYLMIRQPNTGGN